MLNPKLIGFSALLGFLLSCFVGFVSKTGLLIVLLRAGIFAAIFGALGFVVSIVFSKFLDVSVDSFGMSNDKNALGQGKQLKNAVDITINYENLPSEEQEPSFFVTSSVKKYKELGPEKNESLESATKNAKIVDFAMDRVTELDTSVREKSSNSEEKNAKTEASVSFVNSLSSSSVSDELEKNASNGSYHTEKVKKSSELSDLPDLTELVDNSIRDESSYYEDSHDSSMSDSNTSSEKSDDSIKKESKINNMNDSEVLAKAIRTIISNDD